MLGIKAFRSWLKATARSVTLTGMSFRSVIPRTRIRTLPASIRRVPLLAPSRVTFSIESSSRNFFMSLALSHGMSPFQKCGSSRLGVPPEANLTSRLKGAVLHSFILFTIAEPCGGCGASPTVMEGIGSIGSIIEIRWLVLLLAIDHVVNQLLAQRDVASTYIACCRAATMA